MAEETGGTRGGLGARLRAGRERAGLSILQAAEKLHTDAHVLEALEAERFGELGAPVFVRGHIRRYAELVRESPPELQSLYAASAHASASPDLRRVPKANPGQPPPSRLVPGIAVVVGVALIGIIGWVLNAVNTGPSPLAGPTSLASPSAAASASSATVQAPQPAVAAASTATASPSLTGTTGPASVVGPAGVPAPAGDPAAASASAAAGSAHREEPGRPTQLTLHFSADSWVEVYDAAGGRLLYDVGAADSVRSVSGTAPLRVVLGNAPAVTLEVNGRAASLPGNLAPDSVLQFVVSRAGRLAPARLASSTGPAPSGTRP
jgi:cytoskeleton protein RodZ